MARPRAPDHDEHRARILAAAVEAFGRTGYPSASMASLARACGASKAALYHYFPSKDALLFEALDGHSQRLLALVRAVQERAFAPRDELAEIVRALMHEYHHSHAYHAVLLNDAKFLADVQRRKIREQGRAVVDAISSSIMRAYPGRISQTDPVVITMALLGMINFTFTWLRPDGPVSHAEFAEIVIGLWSRGLEGDGQQTAPAVRGGSPVQLRPGTGGVAGAG